MQTRERNELVICMSFSTMTGLPCGLPFAHTYRQRGGGRRRSTHIHTQTSLSLEEHGLKQHMYTAYDLTCMSNHQAHSSAWAASVVYLERYWRGAAQMSTSSTSSRRRLLGFWDGAFQLRRDGASFTIWVGKTRGKGRLCQNGTCSVLAPSRAAIWKYG